MEGLAWTLFLTIGAVALAVAAYRDRALPTTPTDRPPRRSNPRDRARNSHPDGDSFRPESMSPTDPDSNTAQGEATQTASVPEKR